MSFWSELLGRSLGLLGKPFTIKNEQRAFGAAPEYICVQLEAPETTDIADEFGEVMESHTKGEEFIILLTPKEYARALQRAHKNPEDIKRFLEEHSVADSVD